MMILGYVIDDSGCGDSGCIVKKPSGMATNGGCTCTKHIKREDLVHVKRGITDLLDLRNKNSLTIVEPDNGNTVAG